MKIPDFKKTRLSSVATFGVVSILGASMIIIAIVAIAAIRGAGAYSLKQTKEAIKAEAVKLLQENTKRKAKEYSDVFLQSMKFNDIMRNQTITNHYVFKKLDISQSKIDDNFKSFHQSNKDMPYINYIEKYKGLFTYSDETVTNEIKKELYEFSFLLPIFYVIKVIGKGYYQTWLTDFENYTSMFCGTLLKETNIPNIEKSKEALLESKKFNENYSGNYVSNIYKDFYGPIILSITNSNVNSKIKPTFAVGIDYLFSEMVTEVLNHQVPYILSQVNGDEKLQKSYSYIVSSSEGAIIAMGEDFLNNIGLNKIDYKAVTLTKNLNLKLIDSNNKGIINFAKLISEKVQGTENITTKGEEYLFCYHKMSIKDWVFGVAVPTKDLYRAVYETEARMGVTVIGFIINFLMVAVFFMFILIIVVVLFFKSYLVKPILGFRDNVVQMGDGDLETPIQERGVYEISVLANVFNNLRVDLKSHMEGLRDEVVKRQRRDNELKTARQVQVSVLPKITSLFDNKGVEIYAKLLPAIDVAGDYYDFFFLDNKKLVLIIADVSGKGISASFYMAVTKRTLRNTCITEPDDPAKSMALANKILCSYNINMFVTLFLAYYDTETGEMVYSNGGHNEVLCLKNDGNIETFGCMYCAALGTFPDLPYKKLTYKLEKGDTIFLYTDGITEANTGDDNFFGLERFKELIINNRNRSLSKICKLVIQSVHKFEQGGQFDDITILGMKRDR